ncbi:hypothetical protein ONZ45_g9998 [Pleurotus djamor]|nr:hypothetical protein ONZ45_g9998 [Pleurotus djamor]
MSPTASKLLKNGLLNFPRPSPAAKTTVEELLAKDAEQHHYYFRTAGLHNHLSHHLLAAYDLGASEGLLRKIYEVESAVQRPIFVEEKDKGIVITDTNWTQYLGNQNAYGAFYKFFTKRVEELGVVEALEFYVFSPTAYANGRMIVRLVAGALHPFIQIGHGLEFGNAVLVASGIAQTAIHSFASDKIFSFSNPSAQQTGPSVLELLRQVYDSPVLKPVMPYDNNALINARIKSALSDGRAEEIQRICAQLNINETSDDHLRSIVNEVIWTSTLLMFASGKPNKKTRLDFFLMHFVTSSIFLRSYVDSLKTPKYKADVLRAFLPTLVVLTLSRGRPIIDPALAMSFSDKSDEDYNPWPAFVTSVLHAPDSHTLKTLRTLVYASTVLGDTPKGGVPGAAKEDGQTETHPGLSQVDGSLFVRSAGATMNYMGWVAHGQPAREDWDRSALGWDDAWLNDE